MQFTHHLGSPSRPLKSPGPCLLQLSIPGFGKLLSLIPQKFSSAWWNHELPKGRATPLPSPGCPQRQHEAHELTQRGQPAHR